MDIDHLNKCIKKIKVTNKVNEDVEVSNKSPLIMIGKGRQGAVFQFTDDICIKVFGNAEDCEREFQALSLGQHTNMFPKIYAKGSLHIAMEIIRGVDIREYLQSQPLTEELSAKLIEMLIVFKEIGFERIDHHKRQIYIQEDGSLKVIDVARTIWRDRVYPYPRKLIRSLGADYKDVFLQHVQRLAPKLYEEWEHYIHMEEVSKQIYDLLINQGKDSRAVEQLSEKLLTKNHKRNYVELLEGLVYKVFKEEWVKTLLALGYDLDEVKDKIDEYWDYREQGYEFRSKEEDFKNQKRDRKGKRKDKDKEKDHRRRKHDDEKRKHRDKKDKHDEKRKHHDKKEKNHNKKDKHRHRHK